MWSPGQVKPDRCLPPKPSLLLPGRLPPRRRQQRRGRTATDRCLLPELLLLLLLLLPRPPQPQRGRRVMTAAPSLHQVNPQEPLLLLFPGWPPPQRPHFLRGRGVTAAAPHQMMQPP